MIEAVNSAIANSSLTRVAAVQVDAARVEITTEGGPSAPTAPFISPFISIDSNFDTAVIQIRDSETGDVLKQYPSEQTLSSRARQAQISESRDSGPATPPPAQSQGGSSLSVESINTLQTLDTSNNFANAQLASVALNAGAQSGQAAVTASVDVTA